MVCIFAMVSGSQSQTNPLADTIWDGNAEITIPKLIWKKERPKFNRAETVSTLKFQVPIQLWFWGKNDDPTNAMSICFNARKVGADPLRAELSMFLGQLPSWAITQLEQIRARRPGKSYTIYLHRPGWPGNYGLYSLNTRTRRASFQLRNVDRTEGGGDTDWRLEGSLILSRDRISRATFVVTSPTSLSSLDSSPPRPGDENLIFSQGNSTGTVLNIVKSTSKPSDQGPAQFDKFFDLQDQSP